MIIEQNISMFMRTASPPPPPPSFNPVQLQNGGVRLPPFPPRTQSSINVIGTPQNYLNEEQASVLRESIFAQLDFFNSYAHLVSNFIYIYLYMYQGILHSLSNAYANCALIRNNTINLSANIYAPLRNPLL